MKSSVNCRHACNLQEPQNGPRLRATYTQPDYHEIQRYRIDRARMIIPKIINAYKSSVTREIHKNIPGYDFGWQTAYHDRWLRNERELQVRRNYIRRNPRDWWVEYGGSGA